ncbi:hypothetical protein ACUNVI_19555 (plasmid) [Acinetobacter baumannii]|uniref:hypothetical protein n=1 Tax=Acinetobacter calcoaceticus/baumannii complex TaxID=909768 RepID=UPI0007171D5C|nr:hypothetical protein [Acinetobacter baumannii]KRR92707.1 hypothetical protein ASM30_17085 [Acinetobacter baumannii]KRR96233.1 hypothetical protein ASM28_17950 [Acinetobacter baumannii]KRR96610.1 hypothetical protein ASM29_17315 [Acinetobacter baumannii]KRR97389.1 hypothetical protein ASM27_16760 [Acinetobacter baumannii]KRS06937.1 hypothetical protein ASM31_16750 [Acinetobacter baumannii]
MSTHITTTENTIMFPKACTLCQSRKNVLLFAGLLVCDQCQENIKLTNPGTFSANNALEQKAQD